MKAQEIMVRPVITVHTDTPAKEAAALLAKHQITAMPVLDCDDRLVGMVSEADLLWHRVPHDPRLHALRQAEPEQAPPDLVGELMTTPAASMTANADVADVAALMLRYDVRSVPITDGRQVLGILSRRDILRTLLRDDDVIAAEVRTRLDAYGGDHGRWSVAVTDGAVSIGGDFDDDAERRVTSALARTVPGVTHVDSERHHRLGRTGRQRRAPD
jgi:CBS domain-containing protein